jgi:hypothetical protein
MGFGSAGLSYAGPNSSSFGNTNVYAVPVYLGAYPGNNLSYGLFSSAGPIYYGSGPFPQSYGALIVPTGPGVGTFGYVNSLTPGSYPQIPEGKF